MSLSARGLYRFDGFALDRLQRTLTRDGVHIPLAPKAFEVLSYLVLNPGRAITKEELMQAVWSSSFVEGGNLAQQIVSVRKALGDRAQYVVTIPGFGYQFGAEVQEGEPAGAVALPQQPATAGETMIQTMRERTHIVVEEMEQSVLRPEAAHAPGLPGRSRPRRRLWLGAMVVAAVMVGCAIGWRRWHKPAAQVPLQIVVADFDNRTGQQAFDLVLKNALEIDLEQSPLFGLVSPAETRETMREMGRTPEERMTAQLAREVCARNSAQAMLSGSIMRLGTRDVLRLDAMDCSSGRLVARLQSGAVAEEDVLATLGGMASTLRSRLGESAHSIEGYDVPIRQSTTPSFEALVAYSRGLRVTDAEALAYYQQAIQLDPSFAMAYEQLGAAYGNLGEIGMARRMFRKAYDLHQPVSASEQFLITSRYEEYAQNDFDQAARNYELWTHSYPLDASIWGTLANNYTQTGQYAQAIEAGRRALSIDPRLGSLYGFLARALKRASQFDEAEKVCRQAIALGKDNWHVHSILFQIAAARHDEQALVREVQWDKGRPTEHQTLENEAFYEATQGRLQHAEELFAASRSGAERQRLDEFAISIDADRAEVERLAGDDDQARLSAHKVPVDREDTSFMAGLNAALADDVAYPRRVVEALSSTAPDTSTLVRKVQIPLLNAALALRAGNPRRAIELLQPAAVYKDRDYYVASLLGECYLKLHDGVGAEAQYKEILVNPGFDPVSPMYPLAHLGLARSYAMEQKPVEARQEYAAFLALWKDADPGLPVVKSARMEQAQIGIKPH